MFYLLIFYFSKVRLSILYGFSFSYNNYYFSYNNNNSVSQLCMSYSVIWIHILTFYFTMNLVLMFTFKVKIGFQLMQTTINLQQTWMKVGNYLQEKKKSELTNGSQ